MGVEVGVSEQQAIAIAGAPSRTIEARGDCKESGGVRELLYDAMTIYFGGLSQSLDGTLALCLDRNNKVIDKLMIDF